MTNDERQAMIAYHLSMADGFASKAARGVGGEIGAKASHSYAVFHTQEAAKLQAEQPESLA